MKWGILGICSLVLVGLTGCYEDGSSSVRPKSKKNDPAASFTRVKSMDKDNPQVEIPVDRQREMAIYMQEGYDKLNPSGQNTQATLDRIISDAARRFHVSTQAAERIFKEQHTDGDSSGDEPSTATDFERDRQLANAGDPVAQYNLGVHYQSGDGVLQDLQQAAYWFTLSAEQGHARAQFHLGQLYFLGQGVARDYLSAVTWWSLAAEQYHTGAQDRLAGAYQNGYGVARDLVTAYMWSLVANKLEPNSSKFEVTRQSIASELTSLEIQHASQLASEWLSAFPPGP